MRISLNVTDYTWPDGPEALHARLGSIARTADDGGLDTLWVADHLVQATPGSEADAEMLEAFTTLGYLAAQTRRIRLGTMVAAATYREPALLVKAVTTLDVLSGGRAWLGIGAGYQQDEARAMGLSMPPVPERFARLEETLRIARQMWSGDEAPFAGAHYRLERPISSPQPLTRPHPPILIGGAGEQRTLRLVATYADACNLYDIPDGGATLRHKLDVLAVHCDAVGRPFDRIEKTVSTRLQPGESPDSVVRRFEALAALGAEHAVVITAGAWTEEAVATLSTAAESLRGVSAPAGP